jgi:hypothetical protein
MDIQPNPEQLKVYFKLRAAGEIPDGTIISLYPHDLRAVVNDTLTISIHESGLVTRHQTN